MTRAWAEEAGLSELADRIASADVAVDAQFPPQRSLSNFARHFAPFAYYWVRRSMRDAIKDSSPEELGRALHSAQDAVAHGVLGLGHLRWDVGLGRNPDDWRGAPERVRTRIRERSLRMLAEFKNSL